LHKVAKAIKSPIIAVDAKNWLVDSGISAGVALAFVAVLFMEDTGMSWLLPYADPILVILLVTGMLPIPLRIIRNNWRQIIGRSPDNSIQEKVRESIVDILKDSPSQEYNLRMGELGRLLYIQIYLLREKTMMLSEADGLREKIYSHMNKQLQESHPSLAIDIIFTTDNLWVQRSTLPDV
jgi:predicted Co/Zn/Cd cation transporter (cation efflux family)